MSQGKKNRLLFTTSTDLKDTSIVRLSGEIRIINTNDLKKVVRIIERLWTKKMTRRFLDTSKFSNKEVWALWQLKEGIRGEVFRNHYVIHSNPFMMKLPLEVITIIIGYLNYQDFVPLGQVSKSIYFLLRLPIMRKLKTPPIDHVPSNIGNKVSYPLHENHDGDNYDNNGDWDIYDNDYDSYDNDYDSYENNDDSYENSDDNYENSDDKEGKSYCTDLSRQHDQLEKKYDWEEYGKENYEYECAYEEFMNGEN